MSIKKHFMKFMILAPIVGVMGVLCILGYGWWFMQHDSAVYADGYCEEAFENLAFGDSMTDVLMRLGEPLDRYYVPLSDVWEYDAPIIRHDNALSTLDISRDAKRIHFDSEGTVTEIEWHNLSDVTLGMNKLEVIKRLSVPDVIQHNEPSIVFVYSKSPSSQSYSVRQIVFDLNGRLIKKVSYMHHD